MLSLTGEADLGEPCSLWEKARGQPPYFQLFRHPALALRDLVPPRKAALPAAPCPRRGVQGGPVLPLAQQPRGGDPPTSADGSRRRPREDGEACEVPAGWLRGFSLLRHPGVGPGVRVEGPAGGRLVSPEGRARAGGWRRSPAAVGMGREAANSLP